MRRRDFIKSATVLTTGMVAAPGLVSAENISSFAREKEPAKAVKMNGEEEIYTVSGEVLMNSGIALKPGFSGTGFNDNVRMFPDFASRMYLMEAVE